MSRVVLLVLVFVSVIGLGVHAEGCAGRKIKEDVAIRAVEMNGFTNAVVVKRDVYFVQYLGGSKSDNVRFTVMAINPIGRPDTIYVYAGWPFKGATIRTP